MTATCKTGSTGSAGKQEQQADAIDQCVYMCDFTCVTLFLRLNLVKMMPLYDLEGGKNVVKMIPLYQGVTTWVMSRQQPEAAGDAGVEWIKIKGATPHVTVMWA